MEQYLSTSYKTIKKYILLSIYKSQSLNMVMSHYDISKESPYVYLYGLKFHACRPWCQNTRFSVLSSNFPSDNRFFIITSFSCCCFLFFSSLGLFIVKDHITEKNNMKDGWGMLVYSCSLILPSRTFSVYHCISTPFFCFIPQANPYLLQSSVQTSTFCWKTTPTIDWPKQPFPRLSLC